MARTQARRPERRWGEVVLLLLDDEGIAAANTAIFGLPWPTDTLSQPYAPGPEDRALWSAELLINAERARREGACRRGGPARELALYLAHACHHLAGDDDATPAARRRMRARENAWLRRAAREGWLNGLCAGPAAPQRRAARSRGGSAPRRPAHEASPGIREVGRAARGAPKALVTTAASGTATRDVRRGGFRAARNRLPSSGAAVRH